MTETAVSFLLENMLQLINSDNELILKAYEERVIEKEQIEYLYEEMQFLQKFLKDSEEEPDEHEEKKSIVAKIRDVSYRAEDIMDWFVLNAVLQRDGSITDDFPLCFSSFKSIICLARKIWDCFTLSKTEILSVKQCKREMMESLSTLESYMAYKIHLHLHGVVVEEIKSIIIEVREIHQNGVTNLQLINRLYHKENDIRSLYKEVLSKAELFSWAEIIRNCFDRAREDFNPIETEVMDCWQELRGARFFLSRDYYPLFGMLEEMVGEAKKICDALANLTEEVKLIKAKVIKIYEKGLSVTWHNSFMSTHNFCLLLSLSGKIVDLAEKNFHSFEGVIEETKPITEINQKGWRLSWIESLVAAQIRQEFDTVTKEVKSIKREVMQIYKKKKKMYGIGVPQVTKSSHGDSSKTASSMVKDEIIVGLDDETRMIIELLVGEHEKQLKVIPIIGMPGLGKTTLAMKVYNDPFIEYHFHIRAWTCVSQVYRSRDLLLNILTSADIHLKGNIDRKSDEDLGEVLYKSLKGKIYLIVLDDIWELKAWNDLKRYFPNDNNGSRIIFTSRHVVVAVALHVEPHYLRFLNPDESWDLLRQKTFPGGSYSQELEEIGKKIAKKCRGLPLAILVVAGLLSNTGETPYWWRHVAETVSSYITSNTDTEQYMDTLALSYNHLPHHLKSCFLYFGTFPEDSEIPVWKLILLWVAEGFIPRNQQRSLEEVAMDYMMDLIDRSLVIVSKKKSNGEIKACRVHDLLRDLCLRKAQEENFLCIIRGMNKNVLFNAKMPRRICTNLEFFELVNIVVDNGSSYLGHVPGIRSFYSTKKLSQFSVSSFCGNFKLLRVLNISFVEFSSFPEELQLLVHLRYLSFRVEEKCFQPSISNLCKLETFIVGGSTGWLSFSYDIWKMVKLRHLYTKRSIEIPHVPNDDYPFVLEDLQTIGKLELYGHGEGVLRWIPNLKKLTCSFTESLNGDNIFPKLNFLIHLETLKVSFGGFKGLLGKFPHLNEFPPNLKSLTLSYFCLSWEEMSTLGRLPNLEVLKLSEKAFEGPRWDTSDGHFLKLKFLKFQRLDIKQWNASGNHFPNLQMLVVDDCKQLEEIPAGLGDIFTLDMIRLSYCSSSVACSARQIQEQQQRMGYDGLKILTRRWNYFNDYEDEEDWNNVDDNEDVEDDEDWNNVDDKDVEDDTS